MIPVFTPSFGKEELDLVIDAIKTNWVSSKGPRIKEFEEGFAKYCNVNYAVTTTSGTTALHLAMAVLNIQKGDEIIVPNFTMISTALAVIYVGAKPIFVDAMLDTGNIDVTKIEEKITQNTKAIIPVHIYGHPCDMDEINNIAKKHNLFVIEDAAEAHGAEYKGEKCGSLSDIACFSFYGNKLISTGEGGMIVTNNKDLYDRANSLKDLAFGTGKDRFKHENIGFNYRMTNIQAAIGVAQLKKINIFLNKKIENAMSYNLYLRDVPGIITPIEKDFVKNSYWMYALRLDKIQKINRDTLREKLLNKGIDTRNFFVSLNEQPIFIKMGLQINEEFPISKKLSESGILLPFGLDLNQESIKFICDTIKEIINVDDIEMSPAELVDKMSILKLKIERIGEPHLNSEYDLCKKSINNFKNQNININEKHFESLYYVNGKIWDLDFEIRDFVNKEIDSIENSEFQRIGKNALEIMELMKKRIEIKNEITKETNIGYIEIKKDHVSA